MHSLLGTHDIGNACVASGVFVVSTVLMFPGTACAHDASDIAIVSSMSTIKLCRSDPLATFFCV